MKCPKCDSYLEKRARLGIEVDYCSGCAGMWLDLEELDQVEDTVLDADDLKGTLIFSNAPTEHRCPHCRSPLRGFRYRLHGLELEYCENKCGFWLDEDEENRVLELMRAREKSLRRKSAAEAEWQKTLRRLRSRSFLSKLTDLFG